MRRSSIFIVDDETEHPADAPHDAGVGTIQRPRGSRRRRRARQIAIATPDAMILDLSMPRMDGLGVLDRVEQPR